MQASFVPPWVIVVTVLLELVTPPVIAPTGRFGDLGVGGGFKDRNRPPSESMTYSVFPWPVTAAPPSVPFTGKVVLTVLVAVSISMIASPVGT
ncbi:hypothetical protein ACFWAY_49005 [Rhodococcus sp. NPDC059968]|uniref:hypothetical protein n=1 Tax=Rhodococcus sp. NPDC059968 TaxID=3347017 RepID=UPI0036724B97